MLDTPNDSSSKPVRSLASDAAGHVTSERSIAAYLFCLTASSPGRRVWGVLRRAARDGNLGPHRAEQEIA